MTLSKVARNFTVGLIISLLAIGLLPFLFIYFLSDINGLTEIDATPVVTLIRKLTNI
ncbi:hypothetical protein [Cohnella sp. WQ 127256]|uniref:hypothetical protein n=1 Tax=Cohnella sp. WQ 127256 TaxID=2938790 RepID=UPI002117B309|nr:hypothetical protein [Cohnella sp. WQ 127256]